MDWQEILGSWVLIPKQPIAIVHFLGGAFVAAAPNLTYRWLLEQLAKEGYGIITTPFISTLNHQAIALFALNRFEEVKSRLQQHNILIPGYLPIYGMGHSLGCKLHLLIGSLFEVQRAGNILISFNNYPIDRAIPLIGQLELDRSLGLEFTPTPHETKKIIAQAYQIRRNLLIRFNNDDIDQTRSLNPILQQRFPNLVSTLTLPGNHLTPLGQNLDWQPGETFTPLDAIGQWVKQGLYGDLNRLQQEICRWLNPVRGGPAS